MQQTSETTHRLRARTFTCMGTVISLTVPADAHKAPQAAADELEAATAVVERLFTELDSIFSLYRADSEASRLVRGELALPEASAQMRARYEEAAEWRLLTEGAFTPERPDGALDLSGIVKGHAIREAGMSLLALGMANWCLNAGGDVLVGGSPNPGTDVPWRAGIVDPADRRTLLAGFPLGGAAPGSPVGSPVGRTADGGTRVALATSGSAERGDHIWRVTAEAVEFRQVSVAAADVVTADVLATAIVAAGVPMLNRATAMWDIEALAVRANGELLATGGFRR
ncbi:FAD:protein FMN transferase [Arthrobacter globiformis]|uniref:FAD:protein FMN transferase n=1 Tax=Arthrobacter globiformis TaxID=1665 RepID=UPI0027870A47|nr:FAD:protein FMN transferase [Arthrobacter globiformis]MDQ0862426.1 thiamine biosynthesis lipoprotein [Arthrobacter globiformis]